MPSSVASVFLLFGIVLALASAPVAAIVFGGLGVVWELFLFLAGGFE